jgi:hypothetical protein
MDRPAVLRWLCADETYSALDVDSRCTATLLAVHAASGHGV